MWLKIKALFSWELEKSISGVNYYYKNTITGDRKVVESNSFTTLPINFGWLRQAKSKGLYQDRFGDWVDINSRS